MFLDKFKLDGKIAHITGGAKGIGLSIAHALGEAGAKLVLIDIEQMPLEMRQYHHRSNLKHSYLW